MKGLDEIQEQHDAYLNNILSMSDMGEILRTQGIIYALKWVLSDEKPKDGFSEEVE